MTRSQRKSGARRLGSDVHYIRSAAAVEAVALGHTEIDLDHLLLGLLVIGGPSARVLTDCGVELAALRRSVLELQGQDLLCLETVAETPRPAAIRAAERLGGPAVPLGGRARDLLEGAPYLGDDRGLLRAVLDDESRRAERLLVHLGIDVDAVRARAGADVARPPRAHGASRPNTSDADCSVPDWSEADRLLVERRDLAPAGTKWLSTCHTQIVPAPVEQVWALLSDPLRRTEWDPGCRDVTVGADGAQRLTDPDGAVVEQTVVDLEPGHRITWLRSTPGQRAGSPPSDLRVAVQIALVPADRGTVVRLRQDVPVHGRGAALALRWILSRMVRTQLRVQAQGIAQAAA